MFTRDLSANVPLYGQEQCIWCGAASGQMARNGYPNPADRLFYAQVDVWNTIQVHNSTSPADSGSATDPHGVTGCLQALDNPGGHCVDVGGDVTGVEAVGGSSPVLQTISVPDPEPHNGGTSSTFSAAQWFGAPWNGAVIYTGTWLNQYVAVIEPPLPKGKVH